MDKHSMEAQHSEPVAEENSQGAADQARANPAQSEQYHHRLDNEILAARQKRRVGVFTLSVVGGVLLLSYLIWLFLAKGYQIDVAPEDAKVSSSVQLKSGVGFIMGNNVYTFTGNTVVTVSADKYVSQDLVITPDSPAIILITLMPAPVQLNLSVTPAVEAEWRVNGRLVGSAAAIEDAVSPGEISVNVSHPWFEPYQWQFDAGPAENVVQAISLIPVSGRIDIASEPAGAKVFIFDELMGETPLTIERPGGEYTVNLTLPGYQNTQDVIEIKQKNLHPSRRYLLTPEQGVLQFSLQPEGGLLSVNNAPVTDDSISVDANVRHQLKYEKQGYKSLTQNITLKPGEQRQMAFNLEPEYSRVNLTSSLPAEVLINGKSSGTTPLTLTLQTVQQDIQFVKSGYRTVAKTLTPQAGKTAQIFAQMLSEFDARRKEGRPLFISEQGIEMKKFRPRAYVMGSPDNEPYRRRNEHRISVDFDRQIWVSKHEITEGQFAVFDSAPDQANSGQANSDLPVTNITWMQAAAYCHWLSVQEGLEPFYLFENQQLVGINGDARGYRLLTEAEWEWLAKIANRRAPTQYSWGARERIPEQYGNYADATVQAAGKFSFEKYDDGFAEKAPVGSFKTNRTGLFDLDGNVAEWVHDRYTLQPPDTSRTYQNYLGMQRGTTHVVKGGSYETGRFRDLRVARRDEGSEASATVGFRIARYD